MKKLLLILVTISTLEANAQTSVYHAFPEGSASWIIDNYSSNFCSGYCGSNYYEMKGDTIINGQSYNKLFISGGRFYYITYPIPPNPGVVGPFYFYSCLYTGAIRQDSLNKKVYFIDANMTTDTLLYDFNLVLGDTVQSWYNRYTQQWPMIVSGIDSILVNGNYHKRFTLLDQNFGQALLIEGVGWADDLFGAVISGDHDSHVACFNGNKIDGWVAFDNECSVPLSCSILSNLDELKFEKYITLFPNPFSNNLNCRINNYGNSEIILYDISSRKIVNENFVNSISLITEKLAKGLYLYEVKGNDGLSRKGKVVKY